MIYDGAFTVALNPHIFPPVRFLQVNYKKIQQIIKIYSKHKKSEKAKKKQQDMFKQLNQITHYNALSRY